jgi:magnesium-transporting ATPase (P-type)
MNIAAEYKGLKEEDIAMLRKQHGYNDLYSHKTNILWTFLKQFRNPLTLLLIFTIFATYTLEDFNTAIILTIFLFVNTIIGFYHEYKNGLLLNSLSKYITYSSKVVRDGTIKEIPSRELLPQDLIYIKNGDIVPADIIVTKTDGLEVGISS